MSSAITAVVVAGAISADAAGDAQDALSASTASQLAAQESAAAQTREDFSPYMEAGTSALSRLEDLVSGNYDVSETAGYDFRLQEGYKGVERSQAGRRLGGRAAKEMARYGQDYASAEYNNEYNRLKGMADLGQASAAGQAASTASTAAATTSIYGDEGVNTASIIGAESDATQDTISNLSTAWTNYNEPYDPSFDSTSYDATRTDLSFQ